MAKHRLTAKPPLSSVKGGSFYPGIKREHHGVVIHTTQMFAESFVGSIKPVGSKKTKAKKKK